MKFMCETADLVKALRTFSSNDQVMLEAQAGHVLLVTKCKKRSPGEDQSKCLGEVVTDEPGKVSAVLVGPLINVLRKTKQDVLIIRKEGGRLVIADAKNKDIDCLPILWGPNS